MSKNYQIVEKIGLGFFFSWDFIDCCFFGLYIVTWLFCSGLVCLIKLSNDLCSNPFGIQAYY